MNEFESRWEMILSATTRDWVNLNLDMLGVKDGKLLFEVEYMTDDPGRWWPNGLISINGGLAVEDPFVVKTTAWW